MTTYGSMVLCFFFLFGPTISWASSIPTVIPEVWNVRNSVEFSLTHNPDIRIARERIEMARVSVARARVGLSPQVDVSLGYTQTNNPMYSFGNILNQGAFESSIDFNDPGRTDDLGIRAGLAYRLYNGGRDQALVSAAGAGVERSRMEREVVSSRLAFAVVRGFQAMVQDKEMLEARRASLLAIRASLAVALARYNVGDLLKVDLLNLEVQESRASENIILAEHALELSQKIFLNLLGLKEGPVEIEDSRDDGQYLPGQRDYSRRPELLSMRYAEEAALANLAVARSGKLPSMDGFASYQYDNGVVTGGNGDSWMAGVKLNYRLFDGGETEAHVAKAMSQLATVRAQRQKLELGMDLEVKQADLNYRQSVQRLQVTKKMVEQAEESARLSRTRFKEGVILSSDLIDVEMRLTDARVRQSVARATIKVAKADLRRAMGLAQFEGMTTEKVKN